MTTEEIIQKAKSGDLDLDAALVESQRAGTHVRDIQIDLDKQALKCGLWAIEKNQYILGNRGHMVVMAARPGGGKTALGAFIALEVAKKGKVLFYSLEMSKEAIGERLVSTISGHTTNSFRVNATRVKDAKENLDKRHLRIMDDPNLSTSNFIRSVLDENRIEKVDLVVLDYIQLLSQSQDDKRHLDLGVISYKIKRELADKLGIPVLILAQMNQKIDDRFAQAQIWGKSENVRPLLSDMGESSGIAKAADVVMFLHRPCLIDPKQPRSLYKVYIAKNRSGVTNDFELRFSESSTSFSDVDTRDMEF